MPTCRPIPKTSLGCSSWSSGKESTLRSASASSARTPAGSDSRPRFANWVRNRLTREDIVDTGCPLKVMRAEAIACIIPFDGMHRFLPTLLRMGGFAVRQVPVRHAPRTAGRSHYGTWDRAVRGLRDALGVRWLQDRRLRWKLR